VNLFRNFLQKEQSYDVQLCKRFIIPLNYILKMDQSWKKHALEAISWSTDDERKGTKAFF